MIKKTDTNPYHCFPFEAAEDGRLFSPSVVRNSMPILDVLKRILPESGTVLEIAAGTGEHAVRFAPMLKPRIWLSSDPALDKISSIQAWQKFQPSDNLLPPLRLDAASDTWPDQVREIVPKISAIVCINMIHVAPWKAGLGLLKGAGLVLGKGGILYLYGAYKVGGQHTSPSNQAFDKMIHETDPAWGVRDLEVVEKEAMRNGFILKEVIPMPANNLSVIFEKGS